MMAIEVGMKVEMVEEIKAQNKAEPRAGVRTAIDISLEGEDRLVLPECRRNPRRFGRGGRS